MVMSDVLAELADTVRPITRREFNAWGADGWFEDERVELIDGVIVAMSPEGGPHVRVVMWLNNHLARNLGEDRMVGISHPYEVSELSQPVPDVAVITTARFADLTDAVAAADLVIEVAQTSRRRDLVVKARLYAQAAVPQYWVVDLVRRELVVHTDPRDGTYRNVVTHDEGETVDALGVAIPLPTLFALA